MEHDQTKALSEDTRCRPVSRDFRRKKIPSQYFKTSREVIRLAVMMHVRFPPSLRNVEYLLRDRGLPSLP